MQEQMRLLNEREVRYAQVDAVERARQWRSVLAGRHFPDLAADIQADRSRLCDDLSIVAPVPFCAAEAIAS